MSLFHNDRIYSTTISLISGIILVILGIVLVIYNKSFYIGTINILLILILINSLIQIIKCLFNKNTKRNLILALVNMLFIFVLLIIPTIPQSLFPILFSGYLIVYSATRLIMSIIFLKNHVSGVIKELISAIIFSLIGFSILLFPLKHIDILLFIVGIYFIVLGTFLILTAAYVTIPVKYKNIFKRKIRISLPVWLETIVPYTVLIEVNKFLEVDEVKHICKDKNSKNNEPDMEIMVHVSDNGFNRVGHVDLVYNNQVISYGNYDENSRKFGQLIGDGVLFYASKETYIPFCIKHSKKIIFGFGIKLSDKQKKQIDSKLKELNEELERWYPPCLKNKEIKECHDYASELYKGTKAKFYKFKSGKFKTYFVVGVSCCDLANEIIGYSGIDFLKMNGVISPGTYYDCLNREYITKTGLVVTRNIYTKDTCDYLLNK